MGKQFIFLGTVLKFGHLLEYGFLATYAEFQLDIFKIVPARQKTHRDMGCEYHFYSIGPIYDHQVK